MVIKELKNGEALYACESCGFLYKEMSWAKKCQDYCEKYGACSLEILSKLKISRFFTIE